MPPVGFEPTISAGERPAAAHLLKSWVRIPPGAWIFVCCECRVLSGRGLCDELITRPEESYRLCCVVVCDLETSRIGAPYIYDISNLRVKAHNALLPGRGAISQHLSSTHCRTDTLITWQVMRLEHNNTREKCRGPFRIIVPTFKNCALPGCYAVSSGNPLSMFRNNLWFLSSRVSLEDGNRRLPQNVGKYLPLLSE